MQATHWIQTLQLQQHPEGGYFRETYRSAGLIEKTALPEQFTGDRSFSTAIYFLLGKYDFSAFHRIRSDEMWHFYTGAALDIYVIDPQGRFSLIKIGNNPANGEHFQAVVPAGSFFASRMNPKNTTADYSLVGCTVAPGFDFEDFEMPARETLLNLFPQHTTVITELTRLNHSGQTSPA